MKSSKLLQILTRDGWYKVSQRGSHVKLEHGIKPGVLIIPVHGNQEVAKGLERKLLKQPGIPYK